MGLVARNGVLLPTKGLRLKFGLAPPPSDSFNLGARATVLEVRF